LLFIHGDIVSQFSIVSIERISLLSLEVRQIKQHPGMRLYLTPFWNHVGHMLDARIENLPFHRFAEKDQESFDAATDAVKDIWIASGITFELLTTGQVYVHIDEPLGY